MAFDRSSAYRVANPTATFQEGHAQAKLVEISLRQNALTLVRINMEAVLFVILTFFRMNTLYLFRGQSIIFVARRRNLLRRSVLDLGPSSTSMLGAFQPSRTVFTSIVDFFLLYIEIWVLIVQRVELGTKANVRQAPKDQGILTDSSPPSEVIQLGRYRNATYYKGGLYSTIYKAKVPEDDAGWLTSHPACGLAVALKVTTPLAMAPPHDSIREARLLRSAQSSCIIPLLDVFQSAGGRFTLVFPFMPYDLERVLHKNASTEEHAPNISMDLLKALAHIHSLGMIHRDVKPSNVLLKSPSGPAYLADFGIAWSGEDSMSEPADNKITDVGTTSYRAPELLFGWRNYDTSLDMWAAGCVIAEITDPGRQTLFDAGDLGSELALIQSIFQSLGTPDLGRWPVCSCSYWERIRSGPDKPQEASKFPDWGKMDFQVYPPKKWKELLPKSSDPVRDLLSQIVCYESSDRLSAIEVIGLPWLLLI